MRLRMLNNKFILKAQLNLILFLLPLITSCASKRTTSLEVVTPPIFPKEFSSIPSENEDPQLTSLISANEKIKNITVGRDDPFMAVEALSIDMNVPTSFKYYGQVSTSDLNVAFVSYLDKTGLISSGDIGGQTTDLLPVGWKMSKIDLDTNVLTLTSDAGVVKIKLFPEVK